MRLAFLDLETTGLPKQPKYDVYHHYTQLKYYDGARIVQLALLIYDMVESAEFKLVAEHTYVVKPNGFQIRNSNIHHITNEMALFAGVDFKDVVQKIWNDLKLCDVLIAHNILFDRNVLLSELHRHGLNEPIYKINSMKYFCTSKGCINITRIKYNSSEFKFPNLTELYKFLFKKSIIGAHDALVDTKATAECFIELMKRKLIVYYNGEFRSSNNLT